MKALRLILFLLWVSAIHAAGQTVTPFVISSTGGSGSTGGMILSWSAGESVITTEGNGNNFITQGFHQPANDSLPFPSDTGGIVVYTGVSPNGDNFNDAWIIDGIDTLTNHVSIFNRWGDLVWKGDNYDNRIVVWRGDNRKGEPLPAATYFYVISIQGREPLKGWVEITY